MSDSYPSSGSEVEGNTDGETKDRAERTAEAESSAKARADDDVEDVESEWHVWVLAAIVVAGVALFLAPGYFVPELLGTLGVFLAAIGAIGFGIKWAIERTA